MKVGGLYLSHFVEISPKIFDVCRIAQCQADYFVQIIQCHSEYFVIQLCVYVLRLLTLEVCMPLSEKRKKSNAAYYERTFDRLHVVVPKGTKKDIQDYAAARGESLNGFVNRAIDEAIARSRQKD